MIKKTPQFLLPFFLGIAGLIAIITSTIIDIDSSKIVEITWSASVLIALSALVIRFYSLDIDGFSKTINETDPSDVNLNGRKFVNWMTIAMVIGLAATIIIHYDFIFGMLSYLLMQIALIISFSGIFSMKQSTIKKSSFDGLTKLSKRSMIFWSLTTVLLYLLFVFNGSSDSFIVIPYVITIAIMAHFTWYGLVYTERNFKFRWFPVIASGLFFFSDAIIGSDRFGPFEVSNFLVLIIDLTYVFNIFFMSQAILFQGPLKE